MRRPVMLEGDQALRTKCRTFDGDSDDVSKSPGLPVLLQDMFDTMVAENGMGLAANQIGYTVRIFILKSNAVCGYSVYINPEIVSQEELVDFENEGCLSIPGVNATTKRHNKVRLKWTDHGGNSYDESFEGIKAFAVQHEMDHLNGKLYTDQFGPMKRSLVLGKHRKFLREQRRV